MADAYGSALWDIDPCCQVAAICDHDTIILDGAHGASIRWKSFFPIGHTTGLSWKRWLSLKCMENMTVPLVIACALLAYGGNTNNVVAILFGIVFLAIYLYIFLSSPTLIRVVHGGKFATVQAAFFGF